MIKTFIASLAIASTALFVGCEGKEEVKTDTGANAESAKVASNLNTKTLVIKEMDCGGCVAKIKKCLANVEGMQMVGADPKQHTIQISVTDEAKFDMDKTLASIKEATGWDATVK